MKREEKLWCEFDSFLGFVSNFVLLQLMFSPFFIDKTYSVKRNRVVLAKILSSNGTKVFTIIFLFLELDLHRGFV